MENQNSVNVFDNAPNEPSQHLKLGQKIELR